MERKEGYYWCKIGSKWYILIWCNNWYDGMENMIDETDIDEIDECRIVRKCQ